MKKINLDGHLAYFFLAFIATAGLSYMNYLPSMVNALAGGLGFSKVEAGQIVAFNGYGGLIGIALAIFMVTETNLRSTIIKALLILALVDLATTFVDEYFLMLGWRFLAGVIGGICVGLAFSAVAKTKNPDRGFGFLLFIQFSLGSLVIMLLPTLEFYVNANAVFYVMAGIVLASTFLQLLLPEPSSVKQQDTEITSSSKLTREQLLLLLSITLYQVAASAIWAYIGLVGLEANHSAESVSTYIAVTGLLGLLGAMLPILKGNSFGRLKWVLTGVSFSAISAVLLIFSDNTLSYILSMALLFLSWPAVQSFLLAVSAELDESGKLSTIAALVTYLGLASGPLLASSILNVSGFTAMLLSCAVIFLISFALLLQPVQAQESTIKLTLLSQTWRNIMIKYLLNKALISMSKRYDYDVRYMQDILEEDFAAFLKFMGFQTMSSHCGGLPKEAVYAARLGSIMWDDCGPCTQLIINMALENKVNPNHLRAIINKDLKALPDSTALVVRFTELVLSHDPEADELRKEIQTLWGKKGVIAIGFCISSSRVYPAFKYAMGYGMVCNQIQLNDVSLIPDPKSTNNFKANDV